MGLKPRRGVRDGDRDLSPVHHQASQTGCLWAKLGTQPGTI